MKNIIKRFEKTSSPFCFLIILISFVIAGCNKEIVPGENEFRDARDGNIYKTIRFGDKIWMAENLAFMPKVDTSDQESETFPFFYVYEYSEPKLSIALQTTNYLTYGVLYNWPAASQSCPEGWHLPSDYEWKDLELYFGMNEDEVYNIGYRASGEVGSQIKSSYNWEGTGYGIDDPGFNAKPGGRRSAFSGTFLYIETEAIFWTSTIEQGTNAYVRYLKQDSVGVFRSAGSSRNGFSVRCVRD